MSAGAVFQQALREVMRFALPEVARRDLVAVLDAGREALAFINEAAWEAGLDRETTMRRAAGIYLLFCSGNLADDLIDREVTYLEEPTRFGPSAQFVLHNLAISTLLGAGVTAANLATFADELVVAGGVAHVENRTTDWRFEVYREVQTACAGHQYAGLLSALWSGSVLAPAARLAGLEIGAAARVVRDVKQMKERFWSMPPGDRRRALEWAADLVRSCRERGLRSSCLVADSLEPELAKALAEAEQTTEGKARAEVTRWYHDKTEWLLEKYGPGPRVHFHTGLVPTTERAGATAAAISRQIFDAQERMLERASGIWDAAQALGGDVLDVGCGLGGSALFFAERFGARITALTPVARHAELVTRFAKDAGLERLVAARLGDAHELGDAGLFDAAYAIGASNYFDRVRWFRELARVLRPGGRVFVEDTFLGRPELAVPFNEYWLSSIGTRDEYVDAAARAGFLLVRSEDVSVEAAHFYRLSVAHSRALVSEREPTEAERARRERSIAWQSEFAEAYLDGGFVDLILSFEKR